MSIPSTVKPPIYGVVIRFLSKSEAQQQLSTRELVSGEQIDPVYADDQRVVLQWRIAPGRYARTYVVVPSGVTVRIGEGVYFTLAHGDPNNLCRFIPNLIMP